MRRRLLALLVSPVILWGLACAALGAMERDLVFAVPPASPLPERVERAGVAFARMHVAGEAGDLAALVAPPRPGRPVVLVLHGARETAIDRTGAFSRLAGDGIGVWIAEYRGFSGLPGLPDGDGIGRDAVSHLRRASDAYPGSRMVLWGESLGTHAALAAASADPDALVVLDAPFTSVAQIAAGFFPFMPAAMLRHPLDSRAMAADLSGRAVSVFHGSEDGLVPPSMGREIARLSRAGFTLMEGRGHPSLVPGDLLPGGVARSVLDAWISRTPTEAVP